MTDVNVLLVEDNADIREGLKMLLETSGARVAALATCRDALSTLDWFPADVVVTDIGLPDDSGISLIKKLRLRSADRGGCVPAIALTAYSDLQREGLAAGFQATVRKPADPDRLISLIQKVVQTAAA